MFLCRGKLYKPALILITSIMLSACSDSEAPAEKSRAAVRQTESTGTAPPATATATEAPVTAMPEQVEPEQKQQTAPAVLENNVIYQEEIYRDWPYTEAPPVTELIEQKVEKVKAMAEGQAATATQELEVQVASAEEVTEQVREIVPAAGAKTHTINAEARVFNPDILYIQPGDTVAWTNMTSHNTVSVDGLIPEGAKHWRGQLGENLKITLSVEGIYAYVCEPHIGFGMVGVIVAGKPGNLEGVKAYAMGNLQGPYRRIISKLNKITIQ